MVGRYAVVSETGLVETVVIWDGASPFVPCHETDQLVQCDPAVSAGWTYTAGEFIAPAEEA
jgi:hypothetical protein